MTIPKRNFGKTGLSTSILGFGAMRLPLLDPRDKTSIDIPQVGNMLHTAIDQGVNYVDTAFPYHTNDFTQPGFSEPVIGKALAGGYREKVVLATKLPLWHVETRADMDRILDQQLERLDTHYLDVYLAHNLNCHVWPKMKELGLIPFMEGAIKDGRIRHFGFSFHDSLELYREIMDAYDWEIAQIQFNYLDTSYQAGEEGYRLAADRDVAVVVMEPLRGGFLINNVPEKLRGLLKEIHPDWSLADWAFRWVYSHPGVGTVLSGMSNFQQVEENLRIAATPAPFGAAEQEALAQVRKYFSEHQMVNCTACGYCLPCPSGVVIPKVFTYYNEYHMEDSPDMHWRATMMYQHTLKEGERADKCVGCKACEERCPQHLPISELMPEAAKTFAGA